MLLFWYVTKLHATCSIGDLKIWFKMSICMKLVFKNKKETTSSCVCAVFSLSTFKAEESDNFIVCVVAIPHWAEIWAYHLLAFEVTLPPLVKSCRLTVQLRHFTRRGGEGASASRVSPRITDSWAIPKLIDRLHVCVCVCDDVHFDICTSLTGNLQIVIARQLPSGRLGFWLKSKKKGTPPLHPVSLQSSNLPAIIIRTRLRYLQLSNTINQRGLIAAPRHHKSSVEMQEVKSSLAPRQLPQIMTRGM